MVHNAAPDLNMLTECIRMQRRCHINYFKTLLN